MFELHLQDNVIVPKIKEHLNSAVLEYDLVFESCIEDKLISEKSKLENKIKDYKDSSRLTIRNEDDETFYDFDDSLDSCSDGENIKLKINIDKKIHDNSLNVYSINNMFEYLKSETISENISKFSLVFLQQKVTFLRILDESIDDSVMFTSTLFSVAKKEVAIKREQIDRNEVLENLVENTVNERLLNKQLLPTDFYDKGQMNNAVSSFFNSYAILLSFMFLMNSSKYVQNDNKVKFTLLSNNVYHFTYSVDDLECKDNVSNIVNLYQWNYTGQTFDKLTLTRQLLVVDGNLDDVKISAQAVVLIKQAYRSYLRRDLDKYISSQGKLFEILDKIRSDVDNVINGIMLGVRASITELIAFFLSLFFANQLAKSTINLTWLAIFATTLIGLGQVYSLWLQPIFAIKTINCNYKKKKKILSSVLMDEYIKTYLPDDLIDQEKRKIKGQIYTARIVGVLEIIIAIILVIVLC